MSRTLNEDEMKKEELREKSKYGEDGPAFITLFNKYQEQRIIDMIKQELSKILDH